MSESSGRRPIAPLASAIVDRIAAGEVIDSPRAVVRELLDNALDAGAQRIQVELRGGGLELIRVADDGRGIPPDELELAFGRHTTSKLRELDELASLPTFGFRGEALPAIAAVAEVEVVSAVPGSSRGARVRLRQGQLEDHGAAAREAGTTLWVRGLFANLPVRLRFQREPRAEVAAIARIIKWCALANPEVRFELQVDGRLQFRGGGSGNRRLVLAETQGDETALRLAVESRRVGDYQVEALLTVGGLTRPSRQHLALFVNRRRVRAPALQAAVEAGYAGLLPPGRHPVGALLIQAPAGAVDANVHPSKEQVRLADEPALAAGLQALVREVISSQPGELERLEPYTPAAATSGGRRMAEEPGFWEVPRPSQTAPRYLAQLHAALLLCETRHGLVLVDQHRAHERVLFERLLRQSDSGLAQGLLEPAIVEVQPGLVELIEQRLAALLELGFEYERFGERAFRLRSAPVLPESGSAFALAAEALALAAERDDFWRERLLATVACRAAVKKGRVLAAAQALRLVDDLFNADQPTVCPHGSPTVLQLSRPFLRRQFRW